EPEEGRRRIVQVDLDGMAVDHLGRFFRGAQEAYPGPGLARLDHAVNAESHILCCEVFSLPPLDLLAEIEDVRQTLLLHLQVFRQVDYDLAGFDGIKFYYLVIEGADGGVREHSASEVGVPHLRISNIENSRMTPIPSPSRSRMGRRRHRRQRRGTEPEAS